MAPKTAALKNAATARSRMEPLPEQMFEAMTGENLARELSTLSGRPMSEIQTEGVQTALVAMHAPDSNEPRLTEFEWI